MTPTTVIKLLAVAILATVLHHAHGQSLTAVVSGYTLPQNVKALVLLGSPTNSWQPQGVAWSGTNAIKFSLSQVWSTFGTNEPYGGPALLSIETQDVNGTYTDLTPPALFDPSTLGTNTIVALTLSNSVPVVVSTNPPPPAIVKFGWDAVDMRLAFCTTTNIQDPTTKWAVAYCWPAAFPTNCQWTNDLAPGLRVFRLGVLTSNGLSLLIDTNHFYFAISNPPTP